MFYPYNLHKSLNVGSEQKRGEERREELRPYVYKRRRARLVRVRDSKSPTCFEFHIVRWKLKSFDGGLLT